MLLKTAVSLWIESMAKSAQEKSVTRPDTRKDITISVFEYRHGQWPRLLKIARFSTCAGQRFGGQAMCASVNENGYHPYLQVGI